MFGVLKRKSPLIKICFKSSAPETSFEESFLTSSYENTQELHQHISIRSHILQWVGYESCQINYQYFKQSYLVREIRNRKHDIFPVIHQDYYCNWCQHGKEIVGNRYRCLQCPNFDSCQECFLSHQNTVCEIPNHTYCLYSIPRLSLRQIISSNYADTLCNILLYYGPLPCLGAIDPTISCDQYQWISYQEIYQICMKFGSYLRNVNTGPQDMILICATNSREYMISDLTCGIYGYILVPFSCHISFVDFLDIYHQLMIFFRSIFPSLKSN